MVNNIKTFKEEEEEEVEKTPATLALFPTPQPRATRREPLLLLAEQL